MNADPYRQTNGAVSAFVGRRRKPIAMVLVVLIAGLFATASVIRLLPDPSSHPFVAGSGVSPSGSAQGLIDAPGRTSVWSAAGTRTVLPKLVLTWPDRRQIASLTLRSASASALRAVYLVFGDGSRLRSQADASGDVQLRFPARSVVRLTIVLMAATPTARIGLASIGTSGRDGLPVATGNAAVATRTFRGTTSRAVRWSRPTEVSSVRLTTTTASATPIAGRLLFSDGSSVRVASTGRSQGFPNIVAFTPRVVDSVRYVGAGGKALAGLGVYRAAAPQAVPRGRSGYASTSTPAAACTTTAGAGGPLKVLCPAAATLVGPRVTIRVAGTAGEAVTVSAWRSGAGVGPVAEGVIPAAGWIDLAVDTRHMNAGPTALRISTATATSYLQVVNRSGVAPDERSPKFTRRMTPQVDETFDRPISISLDGSSAQYAALKPAASGPSPFGSAAFGDPASSPSPFATERGALSIQAVTTTDASGGVAYRSGLLSSVGLTGGGFSAQYGYFESTILGAPGHGSWGAFWVQGIGSVLGTGAPFGEADATELYGDQYRRTCSGVLDWMPQPELPKGVCAKAQTLSNWALEYHTYGIEIRPDATNAYVDGWLVARFRPQVLAEDPSFFMLNLALGGGYQVDLAAQQGVTRLYSTGIRVWT